jgi:hypothetical protein
MEAYRCYYTCGTQIASATFLFADCLEQACLLGEHMYRDKLFELPIDAMEIWLSGQKLTVLPWEYDRFHRPTGP